MTASQRTASERDGPVDAGVTEATAGHQIDTAHQTLQPLRRAVRQEVHHQARCQTV